MTYPYRRRDIASAADRILADLLRAGRGRPALTFRDAWRLAHRYGLRVRPIASCEAFEAELHESAPGRWTIYYNSEGSERRHVRFVIHEIAEYLCIQGDDFASLFDGLPGSRTAHYNGGDSPRGVRHRVAFYTEQMYVRLMKAEARRDCP